VETRQRGVRDENNESKTKSQKERKGVFATITIKNIIRRNEKPKPEVEKSPSRSIRKPNGKKRGMGGTTLSSFIKNGFWPEGGWGVGKTQQGIVVPLHMTNKSSEKGGWSTKKKNKLKKCKGGFLPLPTTSRPPWIRGQKRQIFHKKP